MNVYDYAYGLVRALKESSEYKRFLSAKSKVESDEKARQMLLDFEQKRLAVQQAQLLGQELPDKEEELERIYEVISLHPKISEYLQAEYQFVRMMSDIQKIIGEAFVDFSNKE